MKRFNKASLCVVLSVKIVVKMKKSVEPDSPELARRKRNGSLKRTAQTTSSSEEEAEASEQSVAASETEDEEVTANAKIAAAEILKKKEKVKVDSNAALLDFTI